MFSRILVVAATERELAPSQGWRSLRCGVGPVDAAASTAAAIAADPPLVIVHGEIAARAGFHAGVGAFGPGNRANATAPWGLSAATAQWERYGTSRQPMQDDQAAKPFRAASATLAVRRDVMGELATTPRSRAWRLILSGLLLPGVLPGKATPRSPLRPRLSRQSLAECAPSPVGAGSGVLRALIAEVESEGVRRRFR